MHLVNKSDADIMVSTINLPDTRIYETMVFSGSGREIITRRYKTKDKAIAGHNIYCNRYSANKRTVND